MSTSNHSSDDPLGRLPEAVEALAASALAKSPSASTVMASTDVAHTSRSASRLAPRIAAAGLVLVLAAGAVAVLRRPASLVATSDAPPPGSIRVPGAVTGTQQPSAGPVVVELTVERDEIEGGETVEATATIRNRSEAPVFVADTCPSHLYLQPSPSPSVEEAESRLSVRGRLVYDGLATQVGYVPMREELTETRPVCPPISGDKTLQPGEQLTQTRVARAPLRQTATGAPFDLTVVAWTKYGTDPHDVSDVALAQATIRVTSKPGAGDDGVAEELEAMAEILADPVVVTWLDSLPEGWLPQACIWGRTVNASERQMTFYRSAESGGDTTSPAGWITVDLSTQQRTEVHLPAPE